MVENGIKPLYVFDGKPPEMKSDEVLTYLLTYLFMVLSKSKYSAQQTSRKTRGGSERDGQGCRIWLIFFDVSYCTIYNSFFCKT